MSSSQLHLSAYLAANTPAPCLTLTLHNHGQTSITFRELAFTSIIIMAADASLSCGVLAETFGSFHRIEFPQAQHLAAGDALTITATGLSVLARHKLDGPQGAYLSSPTGQRMPLICADLQSDLDSNQGSRGTAPRSYPQGTTSSPAGLLPWPNHIEITAWHKAPPSLALAQTATPAQRAQIAAINALVQRLYPAAPQPFSTSQQQAAIALDCMQANDLAAEAYQLSFAANAVTLSYGADQGLRHGLMALAQLSTTAFLDSARFAFPQTGTIADSPRFAWRGCHLDVVRHFWQLDDVLRFMDILSWHRMNILHLHLTEDEGWRIELKSLPELTEQVAFRGADCALPPLFGSSPQPYGGYYTQADIAAMNAHALSLGITIVPEVDIPGHMTAVLATYPHLKDPDEPADSYRSIQNYPNNALNPAMDETYELLETVFSELAELFPGRYLHLGGDEVDAKSWHASPKAQALAKQLGNTDTMGLQAHLLRKAQAIIEGLGRTTAGWDEAALGGGISTDNTLLVAWRSPQTINTLLKQGYDVVASPGQAYYLDMVQSDNWQEPGMSWAGVATIETCYTFEPSAGLDPAHLHKLKGIQGGIWCEHIPNQHQFNYMVFPRLSAIAESAWTQSEHKDLQRFYALSRLMPQL
ncbi:beta-N-acetylhexosaminidase [Polycladidibacter hongkongensis]|uniref:beta-N-acetylhexosaminidase n=1 Tax=Polycladidibacter hongkongensis TaxID=1647556 RepID=UPI00082A7EEF|nr:beta-N-acetylhexosaminidase [Pseudovibrio hongkongensis]